MSKTKFIGGVGIDTDKVMKPRSPSDFYPTEQALITEYVSNHLFFNGKVNYILDMGAGDGRWGSTIKQQILNSRERFPDVTVPLLYGLDIRDLPKPELFDRWFVGEEQGNVYKIIPKIPPEHNFQMIVSNPPYSIAEDFLDVALDLVNRDSGMIIFLLSLNWLASEKRYNRFYRNGAPISRLTICNTRPSFSENGKTYPGREFGIFEWHFMNGYCSDSVVYSSLYDYPSINHLTYKRK